MRVYVFKKKRTAEQQASKQKASQAHINPLVQPKFQPSAAHKPPPCLVSHCSRESDISKLFVYLKSFLWNFIRFESSHFLSSAPVGIMIVWARAERQSMSKKDKKLSSVRDTVDEDGFTLVKKKPRHKHSDWKYKHPKSRGKYNSTHKVLFYIWLHLHYNDFVFCFRSIQRCM